MATSYKFGDEISSSSEDMNASNVSRNACVVSVPRYVDGGDVCEATLLEMHNSSHIDEGYKFPEWMSGGNGRKMKPYAGKVSPSVMVSFFTFLHNYFINNRSHYNELE